MNELQPAFAALVGLPQAGVIFPLEWPRALQSHQPFVVLPQYLVPFVATRVREVEAVFSAVILLL